MTFPCHALEDARGEVPPPPSIDTERLCNVRKVQHSTHRNKVFESNAKPHRILIVHNIVQYDQLSGDVEDAHVDSICANSTSVTVHQR